MIPEEHLDAVMARAKAFETRDRKGSACAHLPGTTLPFVWHDTPAKALAGLRSLVRRNWLRVLHQLQDTEIFWKELLKTQEARRKSSWVHVSELRASGTKRSGKG